MPKFNTVPGPHLGPLPPDPDSMNERRAAWAGECIARLSELTGAEYGQEALGDLVCNLFHWGDRNGIPANEMQNIFASRFRMYQEETGSGQD